VAPRYDRSLLLGPARRDQVLDLSEVQRYGRDSFDDPDYVSVYGLRPPDWYARGVRLLGRTAVECTRDLLADRVGRDVAALAGRSAAVGCVVVDPFAGSGNTLWWLTRHLGARRGVGFELDDAIWATSRRNLELVGLNVELRHLGYEAGLRTVRLEAGELLVVFVAPPWGSALDPRTGLDLRRTAPPVPDVIDLVAATFPRREIVLALQVYESVVPDSLTAVTRRCAWSERRTYDIDRPGRNHGLVLGTLGWAPGGV
jgi:hypothetical protein